MSLATAAMKRPSASRSPAVTFHPLKNGPLTVHSRRSSLVTQNPPFPVPTISLTLIRRGSPRSCGFAVLTTPARIFANPVPPAQMAW